MSDTLLPLILIIAVLVIITNIALLSTLFKRLKEISDNTREANNISEKILDSVDAVCENQVTIFEKSNKK